LLIIRRRRKMDIETMVEEIEHLECDDPWWGEAEDMLGAWAEEYAAGRSDHEDDPNLIWF